MANVETDPVFQPMENLIRFYIRTFWEGASSWKLRDWYPLVFLVHVEISPEARNVQRFVEENQYLELQKSSWKVGRIGWLKGWKVVREIFSEVSKLSQFLIDSSFSGKQNAVILYRKVRIPMCSFGGLEAFSQESLVFLADLVLFEAESAAFTAATEEGPSAGPTLMWWKPSHFLMGSLP